MLSILVQFHNLFRYPSVILPACPVIHVPLSQSSQFVFCFSSLGLALFGFVWTAWTEYLVFPINLELELG